MKNQEDQLIESCITGYQLQVSPSFRRITARIIDCFILSILYVLLIIAFSQSRMAETLAIDVTLLFMVFIYLPGLESTGGTLGKRVMRIKPVSYDSNNQGESPLYRQAFTKSLFIGWPVIIGFVIALQILNHPVEQTFSDRMGFYGATPRLDDYTKEMLGYIQLSNAIQLIILIVCYSSILQNRFHVGWHDKAGKIVTVKK